MEALRLESSSRRDDESPLDADDFRLEDGFRRANGDLEEGGDPTSHADASSQPGGARATMRYTMKQLGKVGRRDSGMSPSKPKPVLHPKVKKVAEQFFEKVRSADPVERINSVLSSTRREFKSSAHTVIMLMVGFSLCNIAWHVLLSWFLVKHEGSVGWILMAPTGFFYVLVAAVVALALSSVNSIDVNVKVQAAKLRRVWEGVKEAEQTFWEQSESVAEHIQTLEQLVKRLENPAKSAMDEALEIVTDKVRARASQVPATNTATSTTVTVASTRHRHNHHRRSPPLPPVVCLSHRARSSAAGCTAPSSTAAAAPPSSSLWRGASPRCSRRREAATRRRLGPSCARSRRSCAACGPASRTAAAAAAAAAARRGGINGGGGASGEASPRRPLPAGWKVARDGAGAAAMSTEATRHVQRNLRRPRRAIRRSRSRQSARRRRGGLTSSTRARAETVPAPAAAARRLHRRGALAGAPPRPPSISASEPRPASLAPALSAGRARAATEGRPLRGRAGSAPDRVGARE